MTDTLIILNYPPYGTKRSFNGLRLATWLSKHDGVEVRVFLMGDAAACAKRGQMVPKGFYNIENMLAPVPKRGGQIGVCGTCMDARGITEAELAEGCHRSSMDELTDWTLWAGKVLVF